MDIDFINANRIPGSDSGPIWWSISVKANIGINYFRMRKLLNCNGKIFRFDDKRATISLFERKDMTKIIFEKTIENLNTGSIGSFIEDSFKILVKKK